MKKLFYASCFFLFVLLQTVTSAAENTIDANRSFTTSQIKELEQIIHNYLVNNPQVLIEAGKKLQKQEQEEQKAKLLENVIKNKNRLFDAKALGRLVLGNPQGKIILTEFTQHPCQHCKSATIIVDKLLKNHPEIRFITVYWPFFGEDAAYTAKAVLAAQKQNKAKELNETMFFYHEPVTKNNFDIVIKSVTGLDAKKLHADMAVMEKELDAALKENFKLAQDLGLGGTPALIFANNTLTKFSVLPGQTAQFEEDLNKTLNEVK
jgi:protein-disulfide isomerase